MANLVPFDLIVCGLTLHREMKAMKLSEKRYTIWTASVLLAGLTAGCGKSDNKAEMVGK
jgi:hypothetical protein